MSRPLALVFCLFLVWSPVVWGQTNPTPQSIPYSQDFSSLAYSSSTYPAGIQGWLISGGTGNSFSIASPFSNRNLQANSTAATTAATVHNYDGKIGILNSDYTNPAICIALNTLKKTDIAINYSVMTIRNPYLSPSNTRINEVTLQYRVGTTGDFTTLSDVAYQNNTEYDVSGTGPQNSQTRNLTLPSGCDNQEVVQIRWICRKVSGVGAYPSFAFDNISVTAEDITLPVVLTSFTANMNPLNKVILHWVTQSETNALGYYAYRADCDNLENAVLVSELIGATNTSQQQMYCFVDEEALPVGTYWYWLESRDLDGSYSFHGPVSMRVGDIDTGPPQLPSRTFLNNPYPNPFNPVTQIGYQLVRDMDVNIRIYNLRGQVVREFPTLARGAGSHSFEWNGKDSTGTECASGIYRIVMSAGGESFVRKVTLVK